MEYEQVPDQLHQGAPLYLQLADILREKIYSREWPARSRIPSEYTLMNRFDIARGTVRKALKMLVDEGLLVQVRGSADFRSRAGHLASRRRTPAFIRGFPARAGQGVQDARA